jgi:outer membrane protein assembly factor BamB
VLALYGDLPAPPPLSGYLWSIDLRGTTISSPVIDGNSLYLGVGNMVNSVNLDSKSLEWKYDAGDQVNYAFPLSDATVGAVTQNGHLLVLNAADGKKISDIVVGTGKITSLPLVSNGTVYITSEDGHLYAVN